MGIGLKQISGIDVDIGLGSFFLSNPYGLTNPFITTRPLFFHPNSFTNPPSYLVSSEVTLEEAKHKADGSQQDRTEVEAQVHTPYTSPGSPKSLSYEEPAPGLAWAHILREIKREKAQRHHELLLIERRNRTLEEQKRQIDRAKYELDVREARCLEVEPFLPVARRLQDLKIGLEEATPWLETIAEKAEAERIDQRTAAYRVASELRFYRQFAGIQKPTEQAKQQLLVLDMFTAQKQQALSILMDLQAKGVPEAEIVNLVNFAGRWNQQYPAGGNGKDMGANNGGGSKLYTWMPDANYPGMYAGIHNAIQ